MKDASSGLANTIASALEDLKSIPDSDGFPVSERLTAFFFLLLDHVEAQDGRSNFNEEASGFSSAFHESLRSALSVVMLAPDVPLVNRMVVDSAPSRFLVAEMLIQLISTSLEDDSEGKQRSAALSDKVLASAASILASPIAQKAVDVFRYAVEANYIPVSKIPVISEWFNADKKANQD